MHVFSPIGLADVFLEVRVRRVSDVVVQAEGLNNKHRSEVERGEVHGRVSVSAPPLMGHFTQFDCVHKRQLPLLSAIKKSLFRAPLFGVST